MTLINCCADVCGSLDEKLIVFDKESRCFYVNRKGNTPYSVDPFESLSPGEALLAFQRIIFAALKQNEGTVMFPFDLDSLPSLFEEEGYLPVYRIPLLYYKETIAYLDVWINRGSLCYKLQKNQELNVFFEQTLSRLKNNRVNDNGLWDVIIS